jgi:predicted GTPase
VAKYLRKLGKKTVLVRHPMPYGDLVKQRCQRYAELDDLEKHKCTIEEREEYEQHIKNGTIVYAGVDYGQILHEAEKEADVIIWDGGNNDVPFYKPTLAITICDPLRPGHETKYYPAEINVRLADVILINKVNSAEQKDLEHLTKTLKEVVPSCPVILCDSILTASVDENKEKKGKKGGKKGSKKEESKEKASKLVKGKKVLCVEDGPTLTHGGMKYGAAYKMAQELGAGEIVDPRPYAKGEIKGVFEEFTHITECLPAMGYGEEETKDLQETVHAMKDKVDAIICGTPIDLNLVIKIDSPVVVVQSVLKPHTPDILKEAIEEAANGKDNFKEIFCKGKKDIEESFSKMKISVHKIAKKAEEGIEACKSKKTSKMKEEMAK